MSGVCPPLSVRKGPLCVPPVTGKRVFSSFCGSSGDSSSPSPRGESITSALAPSTSGEKSGKSIFPVSDERGKRCVDVGVFRGGDFPPGERRPTNGES